MREYGFLLTCILLHKRFCPYTGEYGLVKTRIVTYFMQCLLRQFYFISPKSNLQNYINLRYRLTFYYFTLLWSATDKMFSTFGPFFAFLSPAPLTPPKIKILKKLKKKKKLLEMPSESLEISLFYTEKLKLKKIKKKSLEISSF